MAEAVPIEDLPANLVPQADLPDDIREAESSAAVTDILNAVRSYAEPALSFVKKSALPTTGAIAGGMVGTAIGGPVGSLAGMSLGSGLGEVGNQLLGITEESPGEVVAATVAPAAASAAVGTLRLIGGTVLKAFGGRAAIADVAADITKRLYSPKLSSDELFTRALATNAYVPTFKTAKAIQDVLSAEAKNPHTTVRESIESAVKPLVQDFPPSSTGATAAFHVEQISNTVKDLRLAASLAYKSGNSRLGNTLSGIRNAIFDDAEASGVTALKEAAKAYRRESAVEELGGVLRQAQPLKAFRDLQDKNALFRGVFDATEAKEIEKLMSKIATSAPSGFSGVLGRAIGAGGGAQLGGLPGAIAGGMMPDAAAYVLTTKAGRRFMEKLLVGNVWDAPRAAALVTWARAQRAEDAQTGEIAETVKKTLKNPGMSLQEKLDTIAERDEIIRGRGLSDY